MEGRWEQLDKKGRERAEKIAKAAARLFSRKGYLETTMDGIATSAKISKGGMYHYFKSKTEVLFFILSHYMDRVLDNLEGEVGQIDGAREKLKFIISRHIALYANHLNEAKVLLHEANCLPTKYFQIIAEKERRYYHEVFGILADFLKNPVPKGQVKTITFMLFGMCNWIYAWYDPKGTVNPDELSEIIWAVFLRGIEDFK
ncbi:MAG: TetR/AcrR family transcriptional regulator [Desulfobacteraceae bacterium]|nr:TetR/AcrR family transcriptional regulator [Desulfobacteraceae bacterium]